MYAALALALAWPPPLRPVHACCRRKGRGPCCSYYGSAAPPRSASLRGAHERAAPYAARNGGGGGAAAARWRHRVSGAAYARHVRAPTVMLLEGGPPCGRVMPVNASTGASRAVVVARVVRGRGAVTRPQATRKGVAVRGRGRELWGSSRSSSSHSSSRCVHERCHARCRASVGSLSAAPCVAWPVCAVAS